MNHLLRQNHFDFISDEDKKIIEEFTNRIDALGCDFGGEIGDGYCWGKYMIIYSQKGIKTKKVIARIYIRDNNTFVWGGREIKYSNSIVLRLFFSNIEKHKAYIEKAPPHIKLPFIDEHGKCSHCKSDCPRYRKTYTIDDKKIEKCSGVVFEFHYPKMEYIQDYMDLLKEFYGKKKL